MEFSSDAEMQKIADLKREFFEHILYDEEPVFVSDEATIWDVSMSSADDLIDRCSKYYGIPVRIEDLNQPLWELLRQLKEKSGK